PARSLPGATEGSSDPKRLAEAAPVPERRRALTSSPSPFRCFRSCPDHQFLQLCRQGAKKQRPRAVNEEMIARDHAQDKPARRLVTPGFEANRSGRIILQAAKRSDRTIEGRLRCV